MSKVLKIDSEKRAFSVRKSSRPKGCDHIHVTIDEDERCVECNDCGVKVDPFQFLLDQANNENKVFEEHNKLLIKYRKLAESYNKKLKEYKKL